jgi:cytochrome c-type biogenesis protein CcmE
MKPRHKRLAIVGGVVCAFGAAAALVLNAFQSNLVFFYSPSQVAGLTWQRSQVVTLLI